MRFAYSLIAAVSAVVVSAQSNNAILIPNGAATLSVTAGQPLTIQWSNPSSGTVTIKLNQDPITPDSGAVLAAGVPASAGSATLQIPPASDVNSHVYTIEIIDDTNASNINFSPNFGIQGATGTATGVFTGSAASTSAGTESTSGLVSLTTSTASDSTITSLVSSTISATSSGSSQASSASNTSSQQPSSSTSSAAPTESTTAPDSGNGAGILKVQGGLLAMAVGLIAVL